jgi:bacillithiol system protein YtxJ
MANRQVESFIASNPSVPVYTIHVRRDPELSRQIEEWTNVEHESPQVIVLKRGVVVAATSHGGVTTDYLSRAVSGLETQPT